MNVDIDEAETSLTRLIDLAVAGEEISIGRAGKPVARLIAYRASVERREPGAWRGRVHIKAGFDHLDSEIAALCEKR